MTTPQKAGAILREHFAQVTPQQFAENNRRFNPASSQRRALPPAPEKEASVGQLILLPPSSPLPLEAYLACALSNLGSTERQLMESLSDTIANVCAEQDIALYEPRKKTDPVHHADVPHSEVYRIDKERVSGSDLLIHLCHFPSTGSGEELEIASNAFVPIILVSHSDTKISRMITGIPAFKLEVNYTEPEQLRAALRDSLWEVRPLLEQRKLAFSKYQSNIVGEKIRLLREGLGLTREEVADHAQHITVATLTQIEEATDICANPTLIQLREIATILKTTVADLVEPDLSERLMSLLQEWVASGVAARSGSSNRDRNSLLRRILYKLLESLENDG